MIQLFIMDTQKRIIVWVSAVLVIGIIGIAAWQIATGSPSTKTVRQGSGLLTEPVGSADWTKGAVSPKVSLVEYSDFQCPACKAYHPIVEQVISEYKDTLSFTYRHFPLPNHKNAELAARSAESAGAQGKFWEMTALIFDGQSDWALENSASAKKIFTGYATELKLDITKWETDLASQAVKDKVANDKKTGEQSGVNSTPSFYLNGKKMQNPKSLDEFKKLIDSAISNG